MGLPRVPATLLSTVLGPTVELDFIAGNVVTTRSAAVPGAVGLELVAILGALLVDGPHGLLDRSASLSPRSTSRDSSTNRDRRGDEDGPGGAKSAQRIVGVTKAGPLSRPPSSPRMSSCSQAHREATEGRADAKIISAHHMGRRATQPAV